MYEIFCPEAIFFGLQTLLRGAHNGSTSVQNGSVTLETFIQHVKKQFKVRSSVLHMSIMNDKLTCGLKITLNTCLMEAFVGFRRTLLGRFLQHAVSPEADSGALRCIQQYYQTPK